MNLLKVFLSLSLIGILFSCTSQTGNRETEISGHIENGLRILPVSKDDKNLNFTVYRGDYIVFDLEEDSSFAFEIPSLSISTFLPKPKTEKPYIKMKVSGAFSYTLGQKTGIINVLDLIEPHYTEVTAVEAYALLKNTDPILIDVRTPVEFEVSHINGAQLMPVQTLSEQLDLIEQYKNDDILLYCKSGNRSTVAANILLEAGFTNIYNLRHGIADWIKNELPVQ